MKKVLSLVLAVMLMGTFAFSVSAADTITAAGFYEIGTAEDVSITPVASTGEVEEVAADVDGDGDYEVFFANSDKLDVTYTGAIEDAYYGVVLVEGTGLPTKDNAIFYIDQLTATKGTISFNVYPMLPEEKTVLTLYISCSDAAADLISVVLNYTPNGTFDLESEEPELTYTLGDINNDGIWNSTDALTTLKIGADLYPEATEAEKLAGDVTGDGIWNSTDALKILQYGAGLITSWK